MPTPRGAGPSFGGRRHRRANVRLGLESAALVVVLLVVSLAVACQAGEIDNVGGDAVASLGATTPAPAPATVPVRPGGLPSAARVIQPARLAIPAIGVTATVKPVGVDPRTGELAVPPSVDVVGWYRFGPGLEASSGSVVIAGHVDSAAEGKGAFFRLRELDQGDRVVVTGPEGTERAFTVVAREEWRKSAIPLDRYFDRAGRPRLTLITCGGPFDAATRSYRDNVVITAVPE